jgi:hypothetical protein
LHWSRTSFGSEYRDGTFAEKPDDVAENLSGCSGLAGAGTQDKEPMGQKPDAPAQHHSQNPIGRSGKQVDNYKKRDSQNECDRMDAEAKFLL